MSKQPNLLIIWTDQQRADTLACYGNDYIEAAHINKLAETSFVFENAYCCQPVCTPSRASILSGLWPHTHGSVTNNIPLDSEVKTIAEMVSEDYNCAYFGKWHLGDEVVAQRNCKEWISIEDGIYRPHYSKPEYLELRSSYHHFLVKNGFSPDDKDNNGEGIFSRHFASALAEPYTKASFLGDVSADFLRRQNGDQPFLLNVNFLEPHPPIFGPLNDLYEPNDLPVGEAFLKPPGRDASERNRLDSDEYVNGGFKNYPLKTEWDWRRLRANYCGLVTLVDRAVGKIISALEESGQMENTIIVYTSDHGEMMGDHAQMGKGVLYEESARIPFFIRVPWLSEKGEMVEGRVSQIDLVPTLLDLMRQPVGDHLQGRSLQPVLKGEENLKDNDVIIEWNQPDNAKQQWRTIVSADGWKLNLCAHDQCELYDLNSDPCELTNRFDDVSQRNRINDLTERIRSWQSSTGDTVTLPS